MASPISSKIVPSHDCCYIVNGTHFKKSLFLIKNVAISLKSSQSG